MEELELILETLKCTPNRIQTLGLLNRRVIILINSKILYKHEARGPLILLRIGEGRFLLVGEEMVGFTEGFDGIEEVRPRNGVNGIAELVV